MSEFRRDPHWSSLKVRRMARFLGMRPTQVYKWNWNRKRGKVVEEMPPAQEEPVSGEAPKRIRYNIYKMEKDRIISTTTIDGGRVGQGQQPLDE